MACLRHKTGERDRSRVRKDAIGPLGSALVTLFNILELEAELQAHFVWPCSKDTFARPAVSQSLACFQGDLSRYNGPIGT
jgi:hypothetical protein